MSNKWHKSFDAGQEIIRQLVKEVSKERELSRVQEEASNYFYSIDSSPWASDNDELFFDESVASDFCGFSSEGAEHLHFDNKDRVSDMNDQVRFAQ